MSHRPSIASRELTPRTIFGHEAGVTFTLVPRDLVEEQSGRSIVEGYGMFWASSKYNTKIKKCKG
jgi:hypothetical protein